MKTKIEDSKFGIYAGVIICIIAAIILMFILTSCHKEPDCRECIRERWEYSSGLPTEYTRIEFMDCVGNVGNSTQTDTINIPYQVIIRTQITCK